MKALLIAAAGFCLSVSAYARPAEKYSCEGTEEYFQTPIAFDISFEDWTNEAGYDNQAIEITSIDGEPSNDVIDLKETVLPDCTPEQSHNDLTLVRTSKTEWSAKFLRSCDAEVFYMVSATCKMVY